MCHIINKWDFKYFSLCAVFFFNTTGFRSSLWIMVNESFIETLNLNQCWCDDKGIYLLKNWMIKNEPVHGSLLFRKLHAASSQLQPTPKGECPSQLYTTFNMIMYIDVIGQNWWGEVACFAETELRVGRDDIRHQLSCLRLPHTFFYTDIDIGF